MSTTPVNVALVQHACTGNQAANLETAIHGIRQAAQQGAQLVVLQELFSQPYFCQTAEPAHFAQAETVPGVITDRLGRLAAELALVIVAPLFERRAAGIYHNTAVVLERDGTLAGRYRKMHIPDDPGYHEKYYFTPGDPGFEPVPTSLGRLGVLLCWDQWFPEAARCMALAGADLLIYPTAIGRDPRDSETEQARQRDAWLTVQRAHAITNCLPVLVCNRVGHERDASGGSAGIQFWGGSCIIGQQGEVLATVPGSQPDVLTGVLDLSRNEVLRQQWPFLRDRRVDAYAGLLQRYQDPD